LADAQLIATASGHVASLSQLLAQEFETLRAQDMVAFEALQADKQAVLDALNALGQREGGEWLQDADWQPFVEQLRACREAHHRNETLLRRQLDVVRMALATLTHQDEPDLYDRLGNPGSRSHRASRAYSG
jgi:flagellar biosynthesis/type III secretory pathway chaperone